MNKKIALLMLGSLFSSSSAFALVKTYSITLDVQNTAVDLALTETRTMAFPSIIVNESTPIGAKCYTSYDYGGWQSQLCRNSVPESDERRYGIYEIKGDPYAGIQLSLSDSQTVNGLMFTPSILADKVQSTTSQTLSSTGDFVIWVKGLLELVVDHTQVSTAPTTFTYDIVVNYI